MKIDTAASRRYAHALLEFTKGSSDLDKIEKDFTQVAALLDKHPEISHLVLNSTVSRAEKEDFIEKIFAGFHKTLVNFIKVLVKKKRFHEIRSVQKEFHKYYEKEKGVQEVHVVTAVAISSKNEKRLVDVLTKKLDAKIRLIKEVEPQMLGGMILRFNGTEINSSYKDHLSDLRQKLLA